MTVKVAEPFRLVEVRKDASPVPVVVKSTPQQLIVRLQGAAEAGEWFTLRSTERGYHQLLQASGGELVFSGVDPALRYSLQVEGKAGKHFLFEDVPFARLAALEQGPELREHLMIDENPGAPAA